MMTNRDRVLAFIELWSRRDLDAIVAAMTDDCFYHNIPWPPLVGHDAIREGLAMFVGDAEAIDWRVLHVAETSDGAVLTERLDRFLIGGQWIEMPVMGTFELRDGLIARWRDYFDSVQFQQAMATLG
ncbi:limonene-1,2-epoxide hydrolase [Sphingobium lactosutens]|uniref:limonene-1,2-epoxide hydrolase family protein n=1 Tax=Sphingobium lactosutens TaxID=522773 RepID=UPI0015BF609F|nr:limonene-1,2-epoxide hydrolase family protein [Sphingobium lactosutens]NWK97878.1 limonene-1,2-epoxide hydrolase [Sphingobium lactosutens]